jgi:hypothetical protein
VALQSRKAAVSFFQCIIFFLGMGHAAGLSNGAAGDREFTVQHGRVNSLTDYVLVHGGNMSTDGWNKLAGRDDYPPGGKLGGRICADGEYAGAVCAIAAGSRNMITTTKKPWNKGIIHAE